MSFFVKLLTDDEGNPSSQRVGKLAIIGTFVYMYIRHSLIPEAPAPDIMLTAAVGAITGLGVLQKSVEVKK
jgi:hypothetical protein